MSATAKPKAASSRPYEVGRGKPPVEHQFKEGQSGNPKGRPRKRPVVIEQDMKKVALAEAYRMVTIREGDKVIELPAIAAVLRSQFALAVKGNGPAQRAFIRGVQALEEENAAAQRWFLEQAIEYKIDATKEIERRKRLGITDVDDIRPHPDHVLIDEAEDRVYLTEQIFPVDAAVISGLKSNWKA